MKHSYLIIDDNPQSMLETKAVASRFPSLQFVASAHNYEDGLDLVLQHNPAIIFLEIAPEDASSNLSLLFVNELYRYLKVVPKIIVTTGTTEKAFEAIKYDVFDYCTKPLLPSDLRKSLLRLEKAMVDVPQTFVAEPVEDHPAAAEVLVPVVEAPQPVEVQEHEGDFSEPERAAEVIEAFISVKPHINEEVPVITIEKPAKEEKPLIICVKSYGDYRFIEAKDICYLQADNNSTDIHLYNGEMITAFKTLKHFESVLSSPFVRIHNSYIVNIDYVSRIHTGNSVCYIKNTTTKLPFSKSYKENVDSIISNIANGNYLEI
ncbi:LytR/AlgR family response regulator transcription factor [Flavobacterium sp.]|uniref:LytR/AlgR family response regulator transcription factor n=1 Tax=Flavobacterium sp. TaxID=239 RepID=UPI0039E48C45